MRNKTFIAVAVSASLMLPALAATGEEVDITFSCAGGGEVQATGSWNAVTGDVDIATDIRQCVLTNGTTVNGTGRTTGTFKPQLDRNGGVSGYETALTSSVDVDKTDGEGNPTGRITIDRTTNGTYDLASRRLNGTVNTTRTGEDLFIPLSELFLAGSSGELESPNKSGENDGDGNSADSRNSGDSSSGGDQSSSVDSGSDSAGDRDRSAAREVSE